LDKVEVVTEIYNSLGKVNKYLFDMMLTFVNKMEQKHEEWKVNTQQEYSIKWQLDWLNCENLSSWYSHQEASNLSVGYWSENSEKQVMKVREDIMCLK
jgi:hypothetical protein